MEMQAGLRQLFLRLSEAKLDRELVRLNSVDCLEHPGRDQRQRNQAE
jgi:hypothetical protein